jgi:phospholipid transport system substrate-binding protein
MDRYGSSLLKIRVGMGVHVVSEAALRGGTIVKVRSLVDRQNGAPLQVDYLLHQNDGEWQVFDVIVEGISFVQTFRSVFGEVLHTKSVADVTSDLRSGRIAPAATPIERAIHKQ